MYLRRGLRLLNVKQLQDVLRLIDSADVKEILSVTEQKQYFWQKQTLGKAELDLGLWPA